MAQLAKCLYNYVMYAPKLNHKDTVTFVVVDSTEYGNSKVVTEQHDVKGTFLQNTGFLHTTNQDLLDADAILYPDEKNEWVKANHNRLEGLYVVAPLFDADPDESWYKVETVAVNRDHLLGNKIDNIQLTLKRTEALQGVS